MKSFKAGLPDNLILSGQHAYLEAMQPAHCDDLISAAADGELWNLKVTVVPNAEQMLGMITQSLTQRSYGNQFPFVVRRLSDNKIVGSTRYYFIRPENRNLSIGYTWYSKSAQRTAINTESKLLLLSHAFETLECISVAFHVDGINAPSLAAVKRLGAQHEGILRNDRIMPDGRIRHTHCFSITDNEWPAVKSTLRKRLSSE